MKKSNIWQDLDKEAEDLSRRLNELNILLVIFILAGLGNLYFLVKEPGLLSYLSSAIWVVIAVLAVVRFAQKRNGGK